MSNRSLNTLVETRTILLKRIGATKNILEKIKLKSKLRKINKTINVKILEMYGVK